MERYFDAGSPSYGSSQSIVRTRACPPEDPNAEPPKVTLLVRGGLILLDGAEVARTEGIEQGQRIQKIDGLFDALRTARECHRKPRSVEVIADANVPAVVIKSIFQTSAFAGYADTKIRPLEVDAGR